MHLTEPQWELIEPLLPKPPRRKDGRGRPRRGDREILEGVLWILRTGAQWSELPDRYPPRSTCHDRFQQWCRSGTLYRVLQALADDLIERGQLKLSETYVDAMFASAKKGGLAWAPPNEEKAARSWPWRTLAVFLSPSTWQALPRTKSNSLKRRLRNGLRKHCQSGSSATWPTTATRSTSSSRMLSASS